ncbi:MAG: sulfide/dihydroorotate dehydrogenase-like FAD/NAD-binding protein, partial [Oligoflexia bacterium]|nr:sulfide/dihydroorotate dehydrogenase-like FAD/NAD-binding protein [Oligoflexia bacterium]
MNRIIDKKKLAEDIFMIRVYAPYIASECKPGQFVIVQLDDDYSERIPLTIMDAEPEKGKIILVVQAVGKTTHELTDLPEGAVIKN